jgi:excisionase family DNA binding protein
MTSQKALTALLIKHIQQTNEVLAELLATLDAAELPPRPATDREGGSAKEFLTVDEAAAVSGYTTGYMYQLIHHGRLAYSKPGQGKVIIRRDDLQAFLAENRRESPAELSARAERILDKRRSV